MYIVDILGLLIFLDILRVVDTFEYYQGSLFQSQQTGEQPQNRKIHSQPWLSHYDKTTMHRGLVNSWYFLNEVRLLLHNTLLLIHCIAVHGTIGENHNKMVHV